MIDGVIRNRTNQLIIDEKTAFGSRYLKADQPSNVLWGKVKRLGIASKPDISTAIRPSEFANYYSSICSGSPTPRYDHFVDEVLEAFAFRNVTEDELILALSGIKSNAAGVDGISLKLFKIIYPALSTYILHIINTILTTSKFPSCWREALICPIPKIPSPLGVSDYRPISLLNVFSKL